MHLASRIQPCSAGQLRLRLRGGAYVLTLHNTGAYHVTQPVGVTADAVKYEVDASVTSGRGTRPRGSPPSALLGIACMPRDSHGYAGLVGTNGTTEIARWSGDFTGLAGHTERGTVTGRMVRRTRAYTWGSCAPARGMGLAGRPLCERRADDAYRDPTGYRSFRQVAVYTDTYPGTVGFDSFRASKPAPSDLDAISTQAG